MADLVPCPSCGNKVSNLAASCPACGHPLRSASSPLGKRNTIVLVSVIVVMLLASSALVLYNHLSEARARAAEIQAEFDAVAGRMGVVPSSEPARQSE
jgi:predicted amidophosphoribosyltransferase